MKEYDFLKFSYDRAREVCDPIDFVVRQKQLVYAIAEYLLEKDDEREEGNDS